MEQTVLRECDEDEIEDLFVGRKIVSAQIDEVDMPGATYYARPQGKLVLDNGTEIYIVPNQGGCACSAGDYFLEGVAETENIITAADFVEEVNEAWGEEAKRYRLFVITDNKVLNAFEIAGEDGNGYYGTGFELYVYTA